MSSVANRAAAGELLCMCSGVVFTLTRKLELNILLYILFYFEWSGTPHSFAHTNDSVNPSLQAQRREKVFLLYTYYGIIPCLLYNLYR